MNRRSVPLADTRPIKVGTKVITTDRVMPQAFLGPGSRCRHDGGQWTVTTWTGTTVTLQGDSGETRDVPFWDLIDDLYDDLRRPPEPADAATSTATATATATAEKTDGPDPTRWTRTAAFNIDSPGAAGWLLDLLPPGDAAALQEQVEHMEEVRCGYRQGDAALALPHEPRAEYVQGTSETQRLKAKAAELGISRYHCFRLLKAYEQHGPAGLIRRGLLKHSAPLAGCTPEFLKTVKQVCEDHVQLSTVQHSVVLAEVVRRLDAKHGPGEVKVPRRTKAYEALNVIGRPMGLFGGLSSKGRRSIANSPTGTYGSLKATRPGEYLLLDTTVLDVFAMDRRTGRWVRLELTVAIDLFTRSVVAMRLTPFTTKARDVAGLLYDCVRPKPMRKGWTDRAAWRFHGLPANVVVDVTQMTDEQGTPLAGVPAIFPETIVVDHGKVFISRLVRSVCARMGISIQPARPYTPTDKAVVERWFLTLRTGLLQSLRGYKGPDVFSRGADPEGESWYFMDELEDMLWEWVATIHQTRPHRGLVLPELPGRELTPNEAYEVGIQRAGFVAVPARADLAFEFLPVRWVTVGHDGFQVDGLQYNGDALRDIRGIAGPEPSQHVSKKRKPRWPVWLDDDDRRQVWVRDPFDGTVNPVRWTLGDGLPSPFSDDMLREAKRLIVAEKRDPADLKRVLAEMITAWEAGRVDGDVARKMAARHEQKTRSVKAAKVTDKQVTAAFPVRTGDPVDDEVVPERKAPPLGRAGAARLVSVPTGPAVENDDDDPAELEDDDELDADPLASDDDPAFYDDTLGVF